MCSWTLEIELCCVGVVFTIVPSSRPADRGRGRGGEEETPQRPGPAGGKLGPSPLSQPIYNRIQTNRYYEILHPLCYDENENNIFFNLPSKSPLGFQHKKYDYCEAQGKGRARGGPWKITQRSFMDGGWWMVDILSLMLYTKFGCHHRHQKSLNLQD